VELGLEALDYLPLIEEAALERLLLRRQSPRFLVPLCRVTLHGGVGKRMTPRLPRTLHALVPPTSDEHEANAPKDHGVAPSSHCSIHFLLPPLGNNVGGNASQTGSIAHELQPPSPRASRTPLHPMPYSVFCGSLVVLL
jgi:hypothetical protein